MRARKKRWKRGLTLVEIMMASVILLIVLEAIFSVHWTTDYLIRYGQVAADVQGTARIGMEKMERYLRMGIDGSIQGGGDQIIFRVDTNGDPDNPNYVNRSIYYVNLDGDEDTMDDNVLVYDPDVNVAGDEQELMLNVRRMPGNVIFSLSGSVVTIKIRVSGTIPTYNSWVNMDISTNVRLRNG